MNLFLQAKRASYRAIRAASHGASISLLYGLGGYKARFECAEKAEVVLGNRNSETVDEVLSHYIPLPDMQKALEKLSQRHSIALVDVHEGMFVLVWRVEAAVKGAELVSMNPDDY